MDSIVALALEDAPALPTLEEALRAHAAGAPVPKLALANHEDVSRLVPLLATLTHVRLVFPKWADGRAYSQARLLRTRLAYRGRLEAAGEVVVDMLPLLERCGFDTALLHPSQSLVAASRVLGIGDGTPGSVSAGHSPGHSPGHFPGHSPGHFPGHYQADTKVPAAHFARHTPPPAAGAWGSAP
jgi:hypothetical protein